MKEFVEDLKIALNELESAHDEISLFALFQRDHPLELWDLVVAAPWLRSEDLDSMKIVCSSVQKNLKGNEILKLSHVVILNNDDPIVAYLRENYDVPNGHPEEIIDCDPLSDMLPFTIKRAYLIRCRKNEDLFASKE